MSNKDPKKDKKHPSILALSSGILFGYAAYMTISSTSYLVEGIGMLVVAFTSILCHGTGNVFARHLDILSNFSLGIIMCIRSILSRNVRPLPHAVFAVYGYSISSIANHNIVHLLMVHVPAFLGFATYWQHPK